MIFLSEQPQTGMNEGTWFTQGMCIKKEGIIYREATFLKKSAAHASAAMPPPIYPIDFISQIRFDFDAVIYTVGKDNRCFAVCRVYCIWM